MSADAVANTLATSSDWSFATIKTLLGRLMKKKAIAAKVDGRRFIYEALITRDEYLSEESGRFVDRFYGGKLAPLVSHFSESKRLSKEDVAALKKILGDLS